MKREKNKDSQIIEELKTRFAAEAINTYPSQEDLQFLEERNQLEEMNWRYVDYVEYYDLIKVYGLDLKLMERLKWNMVWSLENNKEEFLSQRFMKDLKIMTRSNGLSQSIKEERVNYDKEK